MKTRIPFALVAACAALSVAAQTSPPPPPRSQATPQRTPPGQPAPRPQPGQAPQQGLAPFRWFAELANACWRAERPNNKADVQCYATQFNRFMRGTIKFYDGANVVAEGDSVFAYDPNAQVIVYSQWSSGGIFGLGEMASENGDFIFRTRLPDGSEAPTRSVWHRLDADSFKVVRQRRSEQDPGWTDEQSLTYRRVAS